MPQYAWYDVLGFFGVTFMVAAYLLLQTGRLRSDRLPYSLLNAAGALLILISLYYDFNFPSFIVEFFWLLISLFGIAKYLFKK